MSGVLVDTVDVGPVDVVEEVSVGESDIQPQNIVAELTRLTELLNKKNSIASNVSYLRQLSSLSPTSSDLMSCKVITVLDKMVRRVGKVGKLAMEIVDKWDPIASAESRQTLISSSTGKE